MKQVVNFTGHTLTLASLQEADQALNWMLADSAARSLTMPVTTMDGKKIPALLERSGRLEKL